MALLLYTKTQLRYFALNRQGGYWVGLITTLPRRRPEGYGSNPREYAVVIEPLYMYVC